MTTQVQPVHWPYDEDWRCETCGGNTMLYWLFATGMCACARCDTEYTLLVDGEMTTTPKCVVKQEYKPILKYGWGKFQRRHTEWTDDEWMEARESAT